jgi:hypothetical protein
MENKEKIREFKHLRRVNTASPHLRINIQRIEGGCDNDVCVGVLGIAVDIGCGEDCGSCDFACDAHCEVDCVCDHGCDESVDVITNCSQQGDICIICDIDVCSGGCDTDNCGVDSDAIEGRANMAIYALRKLYTILEFGDNLNQQFGSEEAKIIFDALQKSKTHKRKFEKVVFKTKK